MNTDARMPRRADACAACGHAFDIAETLQAHLFESAAGYERRDYCLACAPADVGVAALAVWKTRRPAPAERKNQPFDREAIYGFFLRIAQDAAPEKLQFRFVLALLLWRKRVLRFDRSEPGPAGEVWHFSTPRGDCTHVVSRPELGEDELERLSQQLETVLGGGGGEFAAAATESEDA